MRFDLNAVTVFATVATTHSFRRAAEKLKVTPSSVSLAVQKLEIALRTPLIDRKQTPIGVTPAGATLLDQVGPALAIIEQALLAVYQDPET